jgi:hypothetical protein
MADTGKEELANEMRTNVFKKAKYSKDTSFGKLFLKIYSI